MHVLGVKNHLHRSLGSFPIFHCIWGRELSLRADWWSFWTASFHSCLALPLPASPYVPVVFQAQNSGIRWTFYTFLRPMVGKISCSPRYLMIAFFGFATACSGGLEPQRSSCEGSSWSQSDVIYLYLIVYKQRQKHRRRRRRQYISFFVHSLVRVIG